MQNIVDLYIEEIHSFYRGTLPFIQHTKKGKIKIVKHSGVETLEVEPQEGGQYSIAFRFPNIHKNPSKYKQYSGYHVSEDGYLIGVNMDGH